MIKRRYTSNTSVITADAMIDRYLNSEGAVCDIDGLDTDVVRTARTTKAKEDIMKLTTSITIASLIMLSCLPAKTHAADMPSVAPEAVADYIRAVVQSHRAFYEGHVVDLLEEQGVAKAGSEWSTQKMTIPLPVQVVNETSQMFSTKFTGLRYQLISLWPINRKNSPRDQIDKSGLEALGARPERPVTRTVKINDQVYFHAIYPDLAVSQSCVACHNGHPNSSKKDFQIGDIMGGLVIEFPLSAQ